MGEEEEAELTGVGGDSGEEETAGETRVLGNDDVLALDAGFGVGGRRVNVVAVETVNSAIFVDSEKVRELAGYFIHGGGGGIHGRPREKKPK